MVYGVVSCRQVYKSCTGNHVSLVTIFDMLSEVKLGWYMTSRGGSRLSPLLGASQAMVILCLRSIFHIACKCGTGGILVCSSSQ